MRRLLHRLWVRWYLSDLRANLYAWFVCSWRGHDFRGVHSESIDEHGNWSGKAHCMWCPAYRPLRPHESCVRAVCS